jgi:hypothetical protein
MEILQEIKREYENTRKSINATWSENRYRDQ